MPGGKYLLDFRFGVRLPVLTAFQLHAFLSKSDVLVDGLHQLMSHAWMYEIEDSRPSLGMALVLFQAHPEE